MVLKLWYEVFYSKIPCPKMFLFLNFIKLFNLYSFSPVWLGNALFHFINKIGTQTWDLQVIICKDLFLTLLVDNFSGTSQWIFTANNFTVTKKLCLYNLSKIFFFFSFPIIISNLRTLYLSPNVESFFRSYSRNWHHSVAPYTYLL